MKFVKIFVVANGVLIVLVLLTLFVMGRRPGAGRVTGTVEIGAPPTAVMPWLTEPAKLRRWVGWLAEVKGDSAATVGRRQEWVMDDGRSGALAMTSELTAYAPPDSMRVRITVPGMVESRNRYLLEDLGGRTRLTVEGRIRHLNPMVALLEPLLTPDAARKLASDLSRLRARIGEAVAATTDSAGGPPDPAR